MIFLSGLLLIIAANTLIPNRYFKLANYITIVGIVAVLISIAIKLVMVMP